MGLERYEFGTEVEYDAQPRGLQPVPGLYSKWEL